MQQRNTLSQKSHSSQISIQNVATDKSDCQNVENEKTINPGKKNSSWAPTFWQCEVTKINHLVRIGHLASGFKSLGVDIESILPQSIWVREIYKGIVHVGVPLTKFISAFKNLPDKEDENFDAAFTNMLLAMGDLAVSTVGFLMSCAYQLKSHKDFATGEYWSVAIAFAFNVLAHIVQDYQLDNIRIQKDKIIEMLGSRLSDLEASFSRSSDKLPEAEKTCKP